MYSTKKSKNVINSRVLENVKHGRAYDLVVLDDLDVAEIKPSRLNARNTAKDRKRRNDLH